MNNSLHVLPQFRKILTFSQTAKILDWSKLKQIADDTLKCI